MYARPTIAVLATGDEIVDVRLQPQPNQIRNSNTYSLGSQIKSAGAKPVLLPIAPDEPQRLRELIKDGLRSDLLLLAGGVSMGKYDLVEIVLMDLGAESLRALKFSLANRSCLDAFVANISSGCRETQSRPWSRSTCLLVR